MDPTLTFRYGAQDVECERRDDGFWYYRLDGRAAVRGPVAHHTDSRNSVEFVIRKMIPFQRDPGESPTGRALYRLAPGLVNMEPHGSPRSWLRPGVCFEGVVDESSRTEKGVWVLLFNREDPSAEPVREWMANLQRVEEEDCRRSSET